MPENPTINRPWWMGSLDEPTLGGLVRSNNVPVQGLVRAASIATVPTASGGAIMHKMWSPPDYWTKPSVFSEIDWGAPLTNGLKFCVVLNEGGGTSITELVTGKPGTLSHGQAATQWQPGVNGPGVKFSVATAGNGDAIRWTANSIFETLTAFTVSLLVQNSSSNASGAIFHYGADNDFQIAIVRGGGNWAINVHNNVGALTASTTPVSGTWNRITFSWSGTTLATYVDAKTDGSTAWSTAPSAGGAIQLGSYLSTSNFSNGDQLQDCFVWNRALSNAEIGMLVAEPYTMLRPSVRDW